MKLRTPVKGREGFTLIELLIGLILSAFLMVGIFSIYGTCQSVQSSGVDMADAQQNARIAMDVIETELRQAGYGIASHVQTPIVVASEYRVTFVRDLNDNGSVDSGETITYFLDRDTSGFVAASTPNPKDMVLRRVVSDSLNPNADPIWGYGDIVASSITQQVDDDGNLDVPIFNYFDINGNSLVDYAANDPFTAALGSTVSDSTLLGKPLGGANEPAISRIEISVLAESEARDSFLKDYGRVLLSTTVTPRNLPANMPKTGGSTL
jgi:prepilin-type N-terminal cleavage/methylation domain-containing protein